MISKRVVQFSAIGFILSAIGAAVGLGNIWWFPQRMATNGGSTFIIVYFIVLLLLALPLVLLELNYGLFFRVNVVGCLGKTGGRFGQLVGWQQIVLTGFLSIYYLVVLSWIAIALVLSSVPSWFSEMSGSRDWFDKNILKSEAASEGIRFAPWVFVACLVLITLVFLVLNGGIRKGLEVANYIFVPGFFLLLIGLTVYAVFFRDYGQSGAQALFTFEFSKMADSFVWYSAVKQVVFSVGILIGILVLFGSQSDIRMDKGNEAVIIVFADTFIALIAGLLISALIANKEGVKLAESGVEPTNAMVAEQVKDVFDSDEGGGSKLLFQYLPPLFFGMNAVGTTFGLGNGLMIAFVVTLLFAGLSSLIAIVETFVEPIRKTLNLTNASSLLVWSSFTLVLVVFYSTSFGSALVDNQDNTIMSFVVFIGLFQTLYFLFGGKFNDVTENNDHYTFLKLGSLNWFRILVCIFTIPLLFVLGVFGVLDLFGVNYLIAKSDFFSEFKDQNQFFKSFFAKSKKFVLNLEQVVSLLMFAFSVVLAFFFTIFSKKTDSRSLT